MKHIMIVEDEKELREILASVLSDEGYTVVAVSDAYEVEALLSKESIDLVLMDVFLPGENGDQAVVRLKHKNILSTVPFVLMSADSSLDHRAQQSGADDVLRKPFTIDRLLTVIEKHTA